MSTPFPPSGPFQPSGQQPPFGPNNPFHAGGGTPAPFPPAGSPAPYSYQPAPATSLLAVFSLILGGPALVACCCWFVSLPLSVGAIVTGHLALMNIHRSEGRLGGKTLAALGLVGGYLGLLMAISFVAMGYVVDSDDNKLADDEVTVKTADDLLNVAEDKIRTYADGIAHGNTPEAKQLAQRYSELIQKLRDDFFTKGDGGISLSGGKFITYCELRDGQCAFVVHVPEYRKFEGDAKDSLADLSWMAARTTVADTLEPGDKLAVGLKGIALYGSVKVGKIVDDASEEDGIETDSTSRDDLLPFFIPEEHEEPSTELEIDVPDEAMPAEEGTDDGSAIPTLDSPVTPEPAAAESADPFGSSTKPAADDSADSFGSPASALP